MEQLEMMEMLLKGISPAMEKCGFTASRRDGARTPVYQREAASVMDFTGEKGIARFVFNSDRLHLLFAENGVQLEDDSMFKLDTTYLYVLGEYDEKDLRSLTNEISDYMCETFIDKKNSAAKMKKPSTVSRTSVKSGLLSYDPVTLASKLAGMFPELKEPLAKNIADYGEFLCEDFFVNHAAPLCLDVIKSNDQQKMKKLFNILGEIYEDGTNEVQSVIAVSVLGDVNDDPELVQRMLPYLTDTMLEPVLAVGKRLATVKSARMRLENPPKYKPKKQKKPGLMQQLLGGSTGVQQQ